MNHKYPFLRGDAIGYLGLPLCYLESVGGHAALKGEGEQRDTSVATGQQDVQAPSGGGLVPSATRACIWAGSFGFLHVGTTSAKATGTKIARVMAAAKMILMVVLLLS
jgi:hypothetical protein